MLQGNHYSQAERIRKMSKDVQDVFKETEFIAKRGYEFTTGDGYFQVTLGEWYFQSDIYAECRIAALKHCGDTSMDVRRWILDAEKTVKVFHAHKFSMSQETVDAILEELRKALGDE